MPVDAVDHRLAILELPLGELEGGLGRRIGGGIVLSAVVLPQWRDAGGRDLRFPLALSSDRNGGETPPSGQLETVELSLQSGRPCSAPCA